MKSLRTRAWFSLLVLAVVMGLLPFVPAGSIRYWPGWVYLSIFFGAAALTTQYLLRHDVPLYGVLAGDVLVAIGFYFIFLVYRENTFTSATIEIAADQKVISTGPYAIVRHPMYASGMLYILGTPLALGSYWGLVPLAAMLPFLIWRLFDEERLLSEQLPGYTDYQQKVRHRLLPGLW